MNGHGSMNRVYRLIWSAVRNVWIPVAEKTRGRGRRACRALVVATLSLGAAYAQAGGPSGGQVIAGTGSIGQSGAITTITQESSRLSLSWATRVTGDPARVQAAAVLRRSIGSENATEKVGDSFSLRRHNQRAHRDYVMSRMFPKTGTRVPRHCWSEYPTRNYLSLRAVPRLR